MSRYVDDLHICYPDPMKLLPFQSLISLFLWINDLSKARLWVDGHDMFLQDWIMGDPNNLWRGYSKSKWWVDSLLDLQAHIPSGSAQIRIAVSSDLREFAWVDSINSLNLIEKKNVGWLRWNFRENS